MLFFVSLTSLPGPIYSGVLHSGQSDTFNHASGDLSRQNWTLFLIRPIKSQPSEVIWWNHALWNPASVTIMTLASGAGIRRANQENHFVSMDYFVFQKERPCSIKESNARHTGGLREGHDAPGTDSHSSLRRLHTKITAVSALKWYYWKSMGYRDENTFNLILNLCTPRQKTSDAGQRQWCSVD